VSKTNGSAQRKLGSWIDTFVLQTERLESPAIFRRWTAIGIIAAALEQKVWVTTSSPLYPNLYIIILGHPGTGKTRTIREGRTYIRTLEKIHLAPISMTWASLVDSLVNSKCLYSREREPDLEYNSMFICADELGAFIHQYDNEMVDGLSALYDPDVYSQVRRTNDLNIKIQSPQINILTGSTPQNLTAFMPEKAWGQGFTSRLIMVFSDERTIGDDFAPVKVNHSIDLDHDLMRINALSGQFKVTEEYREAVNNWRHLGEPPVPLHPKLTHYITRRRVHLYKLSMISSVDRSDALTLTTADFNRALGWLIEAEDTMSDVFKAGATNSDGAALDEIIHFIRINDMGPGVSETAITAFAKERLPIHSTLRIIEMMERSGMIYCVRGIHKAKVKMYKPFQL
jgi:hypothetical protein